MKNAPFAPIKTRTHAKKEAFVPAMEKFGIFELLDTLSALAAPPAPPKETTSLPTGEPSPHASGSKEALAAFLARHDALRKKAGK